jgi:hypothetical protein
MAIHFNEISSIKKGTRVRDEEDKTVWTLDEEPKLCSDDKELKQYKFVMMAGDHFTAPPVSFFKTPPEWGAFAHYPVDTDPQFTVIG